MLDAVARDQLRTFIAAADEGSFSAAGRKLRRAQSVISQTLRTRRASSASIGAAAGPVLTAQGQVLPAHARTVAGDVDRSRHMPGVLRKDLSPSFQSLSMSCFRWGSSTAVMAFHAAFRLTLLREHAMTAPHSCVGSADGDTETFAPAA